MQAFFRRPLALAALLGVLMALAAYRVNATVKLVLGGIVALLFIVLFVFARMRKGGKRVIEGLICLFAILLSLTSSYLFFDVRYQDYRNLAEQTITVQGTVLERRSASPTLTTLRVSLDRINEGKTSVDAIIECDYQSSLQVGDTFRIKGVVRAFEKDELFDEERFRLSDGCMLIVSCEGRYDCEIGAPNQRNLRAVASRINQKLSYGLCARVGNEEGALTTALLLGNRALLSDTTKLDFQYAGASHLLALSGLHVSIIIAFVEFVLRSLWIGKRGRAVIVPIVALVYLTLTGFSPSTCRAVMMAIVTYLALLLGERYDSFTTLMLALFITLSVTPYAILDLSLWMSYLSAAAIVLIYPVLSRSFDAWYRKRKPPVPIYRALCWLLSAIVIGLSANLSLMLLSAFVFGTASLASIPVTLMLSLPVTALLILALLSVMLPFARLLPLLCRLIAHLMMSVIQWFAEIDGVLLPLNDAWSLSVLAVMTAVIIVLAVVRLRRFGYLLIPPALFALAICVSVFVTNHCYSELHLNKIQTGYGDYYLYTQNGSAVLINDTRGAVAKDYDIRMAAIAQRCTVIDDYVMCRYFHQATYSIASISQSIYIQTLHLPLPGDAREQAIAARLAEEAAYYGIEVSFDAEDFLAEYPVENGNQN